MTATPSAPTPKPVVTIYGTYGAGAKQVGRAVAHHLGLPFFGPAFSSEALEGDSEDVRAQEATFLTRMVAVMAAQFGVDALPQESVEGHRQDLIEENHRQVRGCAHVGGVMIGRHGALLLADRPNTLHVLLTGSVEDRVERAATESGIAREHAARRLEREDHVRADMAIALFGWDPRIPDHYDLVVNTSRIPLDGVVEMILAAVRALTGDARPDGDDAEWVRSFHRTQPGKTYRIDATDEAHEHAAREALTAAARILTDEVRRESEGSGADHPQAPDQSP